MPNSDPDAAPTPDLDPLILETAKEAARRAARIQRERFAHPGEVRLKGGVELVTETDLACERAVLSLLGERFPDHAVLSEEAGAVAGASGGSGGAGGPGGGSEAPLWIVDPLDGTANFAHGFPVFGVSVAYARGRQVLAAACAIPMWGQLFWASLGCGAFRDDEPIGVSDQARLDRALLATGFPHDQQLGGPDNYDLFAHVSRHAQAVRRPGAAVVDLCYVACGGFDGFWEHRLKPWDTAGAALIVREAGGRVTGLDGGHWDPWAPAILATNGPLHRPLRETLAAGAAA